MQQGHDHLHKISCATKDLASIAISDISSTNIESLGIGMLFEAQNFTEECIEPSFNKSFASIFWSIDSIDKLFQTILT